MRKQKTFYGEYALSEVKDYISSIKSIFKLGKVNIESMKPQFSWSYIPYRVIVNFS